MVQYCAVPMCKSNAFTADVSFHKLPQNKLLLKQWIIKMRRDEKRNVKVSSTMRVCSRHFLPEDIIPSKNGLRKLLRKGAVPCIFDFTSPKKTKQRRKITWLNRSPKNTDACQTTRDSSSDTSSLPSFQINTDPCNRASGSSSDTLSVLSFPINTDPCNRARGSSSDTLSVLSFQDEPDLGHSSLDNANPTADSEGVPARSLEKLERENTVLQAKIEYLEKCLKDVENERDTLKQAVSTHVCGLNEEQTFSELKGTKELLAYYTGFDNENVYGEFIKFVNPQNKFSYCAKIKAENQIFIVLMKLRQGFENIDLSARFHLCTKVVSQMFNSWINLLYSRLGFLSIWPDRQVILSSAPEAFKKKFPTTVLILDCTELKIECPSDLVKQSQSYSAYKSHNTVKGLIGTNPAGSIMFISELYTGSISDKKITEMCGLYKILEDKMKIGHILPGDSIMVDKGFAIKEEIKKLGLQINVPPMGYEIQFEPEEVQETRKVASCRANVERGIRKIKTFKILSGVIPIKMMPHINQIWTVCGLLSNFRFITKENLDNSTVEEN